MQNNVKVSVYCLAYNHSAYIEQTIKGFLSQKTNFRFEVIIHDDASLDGTAEIVKKYESEYPDIIKGIYQNENQYTKKIGIVKTYIIPKIRGEYVAICEGDDFWTDSDKLQNQVDALESNSDCHFCVHKTNEVNINGEPTGKCFPSIDLNSKIMDQSVFLTLCAKSYCFHTSSYMFKTCEWRNYIENPPKFKTVCDVGDETYLLYFGQLGKVCYINKVMSAYRRGVPSSWSQRIAQAKDINVLLRHPSAMVETYKAFDEYTDSRYHNLFVRRAATMKLQVAILSKTCKLLLKKNNIEYFKALPIKKQCIAIIAIFFPKTVLKLYIKRLNRLYKKKGYNV